MQYINRISFLILFSFLSQLGCKTLFGEDTERAIYKLPSKDCVLPADHPLQIHLKNLFSNPSMFDSPAQLNLAGFQIFERVHRGLMVARHPLVKGYLFKKFQNSISQQEQLENYKSRIRGAQALSHFINQNYLQYIVVPKKWLYQLPKKFSDPKTKRPTYILIVEEIDICSGGSDPFGEVAQRYYHIEEDVLRELCQVVYHFRGLDSMLHNMPFTYQNRIAFIDTEKWKIKREGYLRKAMPYLSPEKQAYALSVFKEFENQNH